MYAMDITGDDAAMQALLTTTRRVAVVGASADPSRASNAIVRYLLDHGYDVVPVTPKEEPIHGLTPAPDLAAAKESGPVDIVDVFRRPSALPDVIEEAIAIDAPAMWFQLGVVHDSIHRAVGHGMEVVVDRCIKIEHARLIAS